MAERESDDDYLRAVGAVLTLHRYLRRSSKARHESGLSGRQHATLRSLADGPLTMGRLSRLLFVGESTVSELVGKLERWGYARRERSRDDNRVVYVSLTDDGRAISESTPLNGLPLLRERLRDVAPADLRRIAAGVELLLNILEVPHGDPK